MNIFHVLSVKQELFHSRVLTWFLDRRGSHGAGDRYLNRLLSILDLPAESFDVSSEVKIPVPGEQRWRLADIVLHSSRHWVLIENKVDPAYQDAQQIADELAGGAALAAAEDRQFHFVFLAPVISTDIQELIKGKGIFVSWHELLTHFEAVPVDNLEPVTAAVIHQYFEFCKSRLQLNSLSTITSDDVLLTQAFMAMRDIIQCLPIGQVFTAVELWRTFCDRYPDHVSGLERRWAESSNYSTKTWFAARLQKLAAGGGLLKETHEWRQADADWGFPNVRIYRRIAE